MKLFIKDMPGISYTGPFQKLSEEEIEIEQNIKNHIEILASQIGERNIWNFEGLCAAADYIERIFMELDYHVSIQSFNINKKEVKNIEVELNGAQNSDEIVVVGAHYDSCFGTTGANDNGSGVAALLEIARLVQNHTSDRSLRLVAFVNEEPPFFQTDEMGSYVYARRSRKRSENIKAMLSLETIGYYSDKKNSQNYPFPFSLFYPNIGNFIGFVGNIESKDLVCQVIESFRKHTNFPSQGVAAAQWLPGIGWSDQWAFWKMNFPAIMITDTAPYRYPYYHTAADTPEKIDYDSTARVVSGITLVVLDLLNSESQ
jgi:Zn-dependent M28 family amino/carboxypeptidase